MTAVWVDCCIWTWLAWLSCEGFEVPTSALSLTIWMS